MRAARERAGAAASVAVLALALTAACSSSEPTAEETGDGGGIPEANRVGAMEDFAAGTEFVATEPVEFGLLYRDHPNYPLNQDWLFFSEMEDKHKVTFDITSAPLSDWDQKKSLIISSGDAPDFIPVTYKGQETQFVSGGAILPLSDYVQYMPNFQQKIEEWGLQDYLDSLEQADGKYYMLPGLYESPQPQYSIAVRKDLWDAAGITDEPETWDDFRDALEKLKAANPGVWPMSDRWSTNNNTPLGATLNIAAPAFGTIAGWGFGQGLWFDEDQEKFVYAPTTDEYKELVEYFASLVEDGLLDPESLTQDDDTAVQKFGSGQSLAISGNTQEVTTYRKTFTDAGNTSAEVKLIRVPAGPAGDNVAAGSRIASGFMLSSTAKDSPHFLALLQWIDWLYYSDEGIEFSQWGVEGTTYTKDGDTRTLAADVDWNGLNPAGTKKLNADFGFSNGVFMFANGSTDELIGSMQTDSTREFVESMADKEELPLAPAAPLDEMQQEQVTLWQSALNDSVLQNTAAFILGSRPMSEWDAWMTELKGLNVDQYVDTYNQALAAKG
ncbi:extracellular solute-binding protein [Cellulomonas fimi]|uniref:Extracellular solute-binding protein family 1 n=1 Tax=Cellulomonas fimi (strain ATCC 484 / DSM 20113 / JCM 1341 / CCUG 24087 / LMG 16345 / NBRC 15513 / NCIMB 8980 / NCTC 7547 / NRS-133) TaxID=590998 RepID=F4H117_CELFA|nr:extracellular solute-binding protein [Cellulomonas fimi]AEE47386.1 extracellular solute-binding protein family 1 [Cellulomonas fimi ATCC 484]NNH05784.1 extracellular solute-binding protein [Cellulomonas fimi]VEH36077.1 Bacterial extracellular solute-binding protein [Cellulomonas fimi]